MADILALLLVTAIVRFLGSLVVSSGVILFFIPSHGLVPGNFYFLFWPQCWPRLFFDLWAPSRSRHDYLLFSILASVLVLAIFRFLGSFAVWSRLILFFIPDHDLLLAIFQFLVLILSGCDSFSIFGAGSALLLTKFHFWSCFRSPRPRLGPELIPHMSSKDRKHIVLSCKSHDYSAVVHKSIYSTLPMNFWQGMKRNEKLNEKKERTMNLIIRKDF